MVSIFSCENENNVHYCLCLKASSALKRLIPLMDRVLVERFAKETTTKGGIVLPDKSTGKVLNATVVAVGPGSRTSAGQLVELTVKPGDVVLLPEYGGSKIEIDNKEYFLFRESDIMGKWSS
jgi:chaperonin GroES